MLKVTELFAGVGSQTQALKNLGVEHECKISEIDKYAVQSYEAIHGKTENLGDITKIKSLLYSDLATYSFPCQDISLAGNQKGLSKEGGTRSGLLWEVERLLENMEEKPKFLLLENVKNLIGKKFRPDFDKWLNKLEELGYNNYWKVLNAKEHGVPQNRERVFVLSIRKDVDNKGFEFPTNQELELKIKDILEENVKESYYVDNVPENLKDYLKSKEISKTIRVGGRGSLTKKHEWDQVSIKHTEIPCIYDDRDKGFGMKTLDFCPTQRANRSGIKCIEEDYRVRKLTPKECWRLMGFKDEQFEKAEKVCSNTQLYKQAGNSIVVEVLEAIFGKMIEYGYLKTK